MEAEKEVVRARETVSEMQTSLQPEKGKLILVSSHDMRHKLLTNNIPRTLLT